MYCQSCEVSYAKTHDCPFLYQPEAVEQKEYIYDKMLEEKSKRFPAYKRYLGRGKDYYNEANMTKVLRGNK